MTGKIIKGIAGFYYVNNGENKVYQCKAKGVFRNRKIKPLVGDDVEFSVLDEETMEGNIDDDQKSAYALGASLGRYTDPSGSGKHRSGTGGVRSDKADAAFQSSGPVSGHDVHGRYPGKTVF